MNFHKGVTNSTVTNTFVRNTGDDGLAMWAEAIPNVNNSFTFNTVGGRSSRHSWLGGRTSIHRTAPRTRGGI